MRILVIDDDYVSRTKLKCLMGEYGDVDAAANGDLGFQMLKAAFEETLPYALVTVDIQMPGLRGPEVVEEIRKWEKENSVTSEFAVKILMVTGMDDKKDLAHSIVNGAEKCFIIKPVTSGNLTETMGKMGIEELMKQRKTPKISA